MRFSELSPEQQDEILFEEESLLPRPYRADGGLVCRLCGINYYRHPLSAVAAGGECGEMGMDEPVYRQLCDGDLVKL